MIAGVASGVANYFNLDPTIVRVLWAAAILLDGFGVIVYIIMPEAGATPTAEAPTESGAAPTEEAADSGIEQARPASEEPSDDAVSD